MYAKFDAIPIEKQQKILNAAMSVFAEEGYARASTNRIVQEAEISKGLLFHYFGSKRQLFLYLYDYCLSFLIDAFFELADLKERDFFKKLLKFSAVKWQIMNQHPLIFKFTEVAYYESLSGELSEVLSVKNLSKLKETTAALYTDIDRSLFKDGLDVDMAIQTVVWSIEGYAQSAFNSAKARGSVIDYPQLFQGVQTYFDFYRSVFYK